MPGPIRWKLGDNRKVLLGFQSRNVLKMSGRGGQIRTDDFLLPKQALYQAELRPATGGPLANPDAKSRTSYPKFQIAGICLKWTKPRATLASS